MKTILSIILIAGLGYLVHLHLPFWWLISITTFIISFAFGENTWKAFLGGFLGIFLLWASLFLINSYHNNFILVERMANVLPFKNSILLILVSASIGGFLGGFSSLTGYYMKTINN